VLVGQVGVVLVGLSSTSTPMRFGGAGFRGVLFSVCSVLLSSGLPLLVLHSTKVGGACHLQRTKVFLTATLLMHGS